MALVVEFLIPINHHLAIVITALNQFLTLIILWQYSVLIGVRFFSVFHPTYLSNENLIKKITRCSISVITLLSILSSDFENSVIYNVLSGKNPQAPNISKPVIVSSAICIIAQVIVQYKLEKFKKTVDSGSFDELFGAVENQRSCEYGTRFYTHRVEFGIMACPFLIILVLKVFGPEDINHSYIRRLILVVFLQIIFLIAFPGVIIYKNDNMCSFISKLIGGQFDASKNYIVYENRMQDSTLASSIVDQEDENYSSMTKFHHPRLHEPTIPGTEFRVIKEHGAQEIPIVFDINPRDRHMTRILHNNEDNNSIANIDDPMPGCSHW